MKHIKYCDGYKYRLAEDFSVGVKVFPPADIVTPFITLTATGNLTIKAGYAWDGPSGPTVDTKNFMRGSLAHDALYQLMRARSLDCGWRPTADLELVRLCKEDGMWGLRRWWVLRGVRFGGEGAAMWQADKVLVAP